MLANAHARTDITPKNGESVLFATCRAGYLECVKYLIDLGCPVNDSSSKYEITPIAIAAYSGNMSVVRHLIFKKASLTQCSSKYQYSPLLLGCKTNQYEIVEHLLNFDEVRKQKYTFENSPLAYCIKTRNDKLLSLLIKNRVDIFVKQGNDENILFFAVREDQPLLVEIIYQHCKTLDIENKEAITPPMLSIILHHYKCADIFIKMQANIHYKNTKCSTIRDILIEANDQEAINYLRKKHLFEQKIEAKFEDIENYISDELDQNEKNNHFNIEAQKAITLETDHGTLNITNVEKSLLPSLQKQHSCQETLEPVHISPRVMKKLKINTSPPKQVGDQEMDRLMKEVAQKFNSVIAKQSPRRNNLSSLPPIHHSTKVRHGSFEALQKKRKNANAKAEF